MRMKFMEVHKMDLIRFKNVTKKYKNGVTAVNDISLSIQ